MLSQSESLGYAKIKWIKKINNRNKYFPIINSNNQKVNKINIKAALR